MKDRLQKIFNLITEGRIESAISMMEEVHPADLADLIEELNPEDAALFLQNLPIELAAQTIDEMDEEEKRLILEHLPEDHIAKILQALPLDEGADLIGLLSQKKAERLLGMIKREQSENIRHLMTYPPDTAGGLMTPNLIKVNIHDTISDVIEKCRKQYDPELVKYIYVVDNNNHLEGVLRVKDLIFNPPDTKVSEIVNREMITVRADADQEEVASLFTKYDLIALPVVDDNGVLLGKIMVDDVLEVMEQEHSEDMYLMAGTSEKDPFSEPIYKKGLRRLPWLMITLVGEMIGSHVMKGYQTTLHQMVAIAFFIPLILSMAGNTALQSSTIIVRGLAIGEVQIKNFVEDFWREFRVAILLGLVSSIISFIGSWAVTGNPWLGAIIGISMMAVILFASFNGVLIPLVCHRLNIDPAIASGPFVTMLNDILGLTIYLTIATVLI